MKLRYQGDASISGPILKVELEAESVRDRDALTEIIRIAHEEGATKLLHRILQKD